MISISAVLLTTVLFPNIWFILEYLPYALKKNSIFCGIFWSGMFCKCLLSPLSLSLFSRLYFPYLFCPAHLSIVVSRILKSPSIMLLTISLHFWSIFYFLIPSIPQILIALPVPGTTRKILGSYKFLNYYSPFSTRVTETFHHPTLTSI